MSATQQGGGGRRKNDGQPHEPCGEDAKGSPLQRTLEAHEGAVQGTGDAGLERVPDAWRKRGGAPKGKRNGAYRHGGYTQEALAASQYVRAMVKLLKPTLDEIA